MAHLLEKVERRLGEKLMLKADRCSGPKCALVRRKSPPGVHGKKVGGRGRRRELSDFAVLMREKQKVRFMYGLDDRDIKRYTREAVEFPGVFSSVFLRLIESRLDNAVFRAGFAASRRRARQLVSHGHITVNGKTVRTPSYRVSRGEVIAPKARALASGLFQNLDLYLKNYEPPTWLAVNKEQRTASVTRLPDTADALTIADIPKIKEFYSS